MNWLNQLEYKYGRRFGIPNLIIYVIATMFAVFIIQEVLPTSIMQYIGFHRGLILQGEIWRLITFIFEPISYRPLTLMISLYFYYFIGTTLENHWGHFRFTMYYLFGIIGAMIGGFIVGGTTNAYLNLSLFFAFAQLFPNMQVLLFFIIPIKIKYLSWVNWAFFLYSFITYGWVQRIAIVFSLLNFFLFFGQDIYRDLKGKYDQHQHKKNFKNNNDFWK